MTRTIGLPVSAIDAGPGAADALLDDILAEALSRRASDVHLDPAGDGVSVGLRVDGLLHPRGRRLSRREHELLLGRLKVLADLNIAERRRPQAGAFVRSAPSGRGPW